MKNLFLFLIVICNFCFSTEIKSINGRVTEIATGKPLEDCMVFIYELDTKSTSMHVTDSSGTFNFKNLTGSFALLTVQKMGYDGAEFGPIKISNRKIPEIRFELTQMPHLLENVVVSAKRIYEKLESNGFYFRKEMGFGKFLTYEEIKKRDLNNMSSIINAVPGLYITANKVLSSRYNGSTFRNSPIAVYLDGMLMDNMIDGNTPLKFALDGFVNPEEIIGVEFYRRGIGISMRYSSMRTAGPVLFIWTR